MISAHDPTWVAIKKHLEAEVEKLRLQNDSLDLPELKTVALRARIAAVKDLLRLPEKLAAGAVFVEPS